MAEIHKMAEIDRIAKITKSDKLTQKLQSNSKKGLYQQITTIGKSEKSTK